MVATIQITRYLHTHNNLLLMLISKWVTNFSAWMFAASQYVLWAWLG